MLARAYVNVSTNPIHGTDMKTDIFWEHVRQKWTELSAIEQIEADLTRTAKALRLRFTRRMQKDMNLWNSFYIRVCGQKESGVNDPDMLIRKADALFKRETKKEFVFGGCVVALQQMPKFQPMLNNNISDEQSFAVAMELGDNEFPMADVSVVDETDEDEKKCLQK